MSALAQPRVRIPRSARAGEVIEIRTLMEHPMETGIRGGVPGAVARDVLARLVIRRDGEVIFAAELGNGTSPNPYHVVHVRMERTAEFEFVWTDERGRSARAAARVLVG